MKLGLSSLLSVFRPKSRSNVQSASIRGDHNSVEQHIHVTVDAGDDVSRDWLVQAIPGLSPRSPIHDTFNVKESSEQEEIKRIIEYRQIATEGDSETALKLLEKLKLDERYSSGFLAFRLNFNIGIIQENMGEVESASISLRNAHGYYPEDKKAQTGLALAALNEGKNEEALTRAKDLIGYEGDHQSLAVVIALHAAARLKQEFDVTAYSLQKPNNPDVVYAHLDYINSLKPNDYAKAVEDAYEADPSNAAVAWMWAQSVLDNVQQNQAFLLGATVEEAFEEQVAKSASILRNELEASLKRRPPNKLLLPSIANNAAVALRLAGNVADAAKLLDRVLEEYPSLQAELAQVRAVLLLQEDRDHDALKLIESFNERPDLQIMASEIEAKIGRQKEALNRVNEALKRTMPSELRLTALTTKARIAINSSDRTAADEAIEELAADNSTSLELVLVRSAYARAFELQSAEEVEQLPTIEKDKTDSDRKLLASLANAHEWDFLTILQAADELLARGYYRDCADLLRDKVSFTKESPALRTLCEACVRGSLGTIAKEIADNLSPDVKNSVFGWKFIANVSYLHGEIQKAIPATRKLFENNPKSLGALQWYIQSLLRANDRSRIGRIVADLKDEDLVGTIREKQEYVNLLVFCGKIERARTYAYQLFCENRNGNKAWMAVSSSVLAFGRPPGTGDDLHLAAVQENAAFEILRADGTKQTFILEANRRLLLLREENISLDHRIAKAAIGKQEGETFIWPFGRGDESVTISSIKHKVLDAFHHILKRFEEQFPDVNAFKSVSITPNQRDGFDEMKALLQQRAEYAQQKAREYEEGAYPLPILGSHLGIDPVDAFLGLKRECNISPKVSSCSKADQDKASSALKRARKTGIIADPVTCHLLRRLEIEKTVEKEFGKIGVTQTTIDIFAKRLQDAEQSSFFEAEDGIKRTSTIAVHEGNLVISERTEDEIKARIVLLKSDLDWLQQDCLLLPTVAKTDPTDEIIRFRNRDGGRFLDDIFAADGSGRLLLSDDFHLRQWAEQLFGVESVWTQALLFHLEEVGLIDQEKVVKSTVNLSDIGEEVLSLSSNRLVTAVNMLNTGELSEAEFDLFCSLLGQPNAEMQSHLPVAALAIGEIWSIRSLLACREKATSTILRKLVRNQSENYNEVLDMVRLMVRNPRIAEYIDGWRIGHFLVK